MSSISDIKSKLNSKNMAILTLCDRFLDQRIEMERLRGESAAFRANVVLGTVGAASVLLLFFAADIVELGTFATLIYVASVLWLARAVWYSIKSMRNQSRYRLSAESIFSFQGKTELSAMQELLAGKLWEYKHSVQPNSERLFYAQRAQRALITFVGLLLFLGLVAMGGELELIGGYCLTVVFLVVIIFFWFGGDRLVEKIGIWNH